MGFIRSVLEVVFISINVLKLDCLEILELEVPMQTELFLPVRLSCRFRLGYSRLYSVKWYKDDEEFFRFTPFQRPMVKDFFVPGVKVELEASDMHVVKLKNVSRLSEGDYRCEVSSDGPDFQSVHRSARMNVYALPDRKPVIQLRKNSFTAGEEIIAECSSGKSYPQQKLEWYLNGIRINESCKIDERTTVTGTGLYRSYSKVKITTSGGPGPILLTCLGESSLQQYPLRDRAEISLLDEPIHQRFMDTSLGNNFGFQLRTTFSIMLKLASFIGIYIYAHMVVYFIR